MKIPTTKTETLSLEQQIEAAIKEKLKGSGGKITTITTETYHGKLFFTVTGQTTTNAAVNMVLFIKCYKKNEPIPICTDVEQKMLTTYAKYKGREKEYFTTFLLTKDSSLKSLQKDNWKEVYCKPAAHLK